MRESYNYKLTSHPRVEDVLTCGRQPVKTARQMEPHNKPHNPVSYVLIVFLRQFEVEFKLRAVENVCQVITELANLGR